MRKTDRKIITNCCLQQGTDFVLVIQAFRSARALHFNALKYCMA
jgi:hypothetical protein